MSDWWARKFGAAPPHPRPSPGPFLGSLGSAWWQEPQQYQGGNGNPAGPQSPGPGVAELRRIPADQLSQAQMEEVAAWELQNKARYNHACPQCGSGNFAPAGTRLGTTTLGSDKCFDCGASSSAYTSSPEPAPGGRGTGAGGRTLAVRQIDTGGAAGSMYLKLGGLPASYVPRGS